MACYHRASTARRCIACAPAAWCCPRTSIGSRPRRISSGLPRRHGSIATVSPEASLDNPYTRGIAEFVAGLRYEDVPNEVRQRLKLLILDALGCALYGADLDWCRR